MGNEFWIACSLKATVILLAACGLCAALRRSSAAARHLVWTAALAALLLLPLLSRVTPKVGQPIRLPSSRASRARHAIAASTLPAAPADRDWIALVWVLGAAVVLARFGVGTARVWLRARRARPMAVSGMSERVTVLDAGRGVMPMTWGAIRPVILLPAEAAEWPSGRLRAVLLHELAHVARRDCLTLAMAELAVALYWFHPLAWLVVSRMRRERERACDDRVLAAGIAASDYAADLLEIARGLDATSSSLRAAPAMAAASNLETRLRAILDPKMRRRAVSARVVAAACAVAMLVLLPLASLRLHGQGVSSGLSGAIYDASGAAVPEASVSAVSTNNGLAQTIASGPDGNYSFRDLPAGRYQVMITRPGFAVYVARAVTVPGVLDVVLSLGQISESLTISGKRSQASPSPAPRRIRVGGNVQAARLLEGPRPAYPPHAEAAGIQGRVLLQAVVRIDGAIGGLSVLSSPDPELAEAAKEAVSQWRYQPTLLNGQPVEVLTTISVNFRLDQ
jgi:TonB family protein